jgi:predicted DNA-binding transcriptional regulator AlpA
MPDGRGVRRSPGPGWVITAAAAERLGVSSSTVDRLRADGRLEALKNDRAWWISQSSLDVVARERARWVSQEVGAELVGVPLSTLRGAVVRGEVRSRGTARALPSLERSEVEAWAQARRRHSAERARRRQEAHERGQAPRDGRVWLDAETVAIMLGVSESWVRHLAREDRLPHTRKGRRVWFLREHIESAAAARVLTQQRHSGTG